MSIIQIDENVRGWSVRQVILGTLTVLGIGLGFWLLYRFYFVFFSLLVAIMLHIAMKPAVETLHRWGVARKLGVVLVYLLLSIGLLGFVGLLVPMITAQFQLIGLKLPAYYQSGRDFLQHSKIGLFPILASYLPGELTLARLPFFTSSATAGAEPISWLTLGNLGETIFIAISVLVMAFYWTLDRDRILYTLLLSVPMERRENLRELISEMESKVGAFYRGQLVLCVLIGGLSLLAYWLIGLPYAFVLALFAFVLEAVPMIGPILAAVPALLIALSIGLDKTIWVLIAVLGIQFIENNFLVPRVMDRAVGVNAIISMLAIAAFSLLFGLIGALLAIPLAAILQILVNRLVFDKPATETESGIDLTDGNVTAAGRGRFGVLRLEAQELAQDVRKRLRTEGIEIAEPVQEIEELIEVYATELDNLLAEWVKNAAPANAGPGEFLTDPKSGPQPAKGVV